MDLYQRPFAIPDEEDLLDFEVTSAFSEIFLSCNAPQELVEFEFQMSSSFHVEEIFPTPADELFHDGKMVPFQRKPSLKRGSVTSSIDTQCKLLLPIVSSAPCSYTTSPSESCQVTPFQSCRQSNDLKFDDCFIDYEISNVIDIDNTWPQQSCYINIKQLFFGQKLSSSKEFMKSLFHVCSSEPSCHSKPVKVIKSTHTQNIKSSYTPKKRPFLLSQSKRHSMLRCDASNTKEKEIKRDTLSESKRSLFGAINWLSRSKRSSVSPVYGSASSSSSSSHLRACNDSSSLIQRRSTFIPKTEISIAEAILHCKQSHL